MTVGDSAASKPRPRRRVVELLQWSVAESAQEVQVGLAGELDLSTATLLGDELAYILREEPTTVTLDLTQLTFCDSSGIHCLLRASARAEAIGCVLTARHPSPAVLRVMELCGVDEILLDGRSEGPAATRR